MMVLLTQIKNGFMKMKMNEMYEDIQFLLDQLNKQESYQDRYKIREIELKYSNQDAYYEGRARRDNMTSVGNLEYDT